MLPRVLSGAAVCRNPFKPPSSKLSDSYNNNQDLTRRLSARKRFVPWGSPTPTPRPTTPLLELDLNADVDVDVAGEVKPSLPPGIDPLVLWHPPQHHEHEDEPPNSNPNSNLTTITVDPLLVRFLRPHQR